MSFHPDIHPTDFLSQEHFHRAGLPACSSRAGLSDRSGSGRHREGNGPGGPFYARFFLVALLLFLALSCSAELSAQDFKLFAPKLPPTGEGGTIREAAEDEPDPDAEAASIELLPSLKGLVFVPKVSDIRVNGRPGVKGVLVENVELMDQVEWQERLSDRIGTRFTMADLNAVLREVIVYYREAGRPVVDVVVVEQDITSGVVQLAVVEAHLGEVRAEGARYFSAERMAGQIRLKPGGPILSTPLMEDLAWLNRNPFRSVDLVYTPGEEDGATDIVLQIDDRYPARVYGGYEDSGNTLTRDDRWYTGVNLGNAWGIDHQVNYQWTFNDQLDSLSAHALTYLAPLPWRHTATFFGAYVESDADLPIPLDNGGHTLQLSGRYAIPLPVPSDVKRSRFDHELELGYDFKNSTSNLEFNQVTVTDIDTDIHQFVVAYRATVRDSLGATVFGASGFFSPGDLGSRNDDASFQIARAGSDSTYFYGRLDLERMTRLPAGFTSILKGSYQFADENLLPSEQLGFGGYSSVRGYEEREANVDEGFLLTAELRAPSVSLLQCLKVPDAVDEFQALVFWDYATGGNVNLLPGEPGTISLASVGPGFRWAIGDNFSMRFDYGFQLRDSGQGLGLGDSRVHLGATISY